MANGGVNLGGLFFWIFCCTWLLSSRTRRPAPPPPPTSTTVVIDRGDDGVQRAYVVSEPSVSAADEMPLLACDTASVVRHVHTSCD